MNLIKHKTISSKFNWAIVLSAFVAVLISSFTITGYLIHRFADDIKENDKLFMEGLATNVRGFIDHAFSLNYQLATNLTIIEAVAFAEKDWDLRLAKYSSTYDTVSGFNANSGLPLLVTNQNKYDFVELFFVQDARGDQVARSFGPLGHRGHRWWFKKMSTDGRYSPFVSKSYYSMTGNKMVASMFHPIYRAGIVIGVMGTDINFEKLQEMVTKYIAATDCYAIVIDNEGAIIAHPDASRLRELYNLKELTKRILVTSKDGKPAQDELGYHKTIEEKLDYPREVSRYVSAALNGQKGVLENIVLEGVKSTVYFHPVPLPGEGENQNYAILLVRRHATIIKTQAAIFGFALMITAVVIFGMIALFRSQFRKIVLDPLETLTNAMQGTKTAEPQEVKLETNDEFQLLADTYNRMRGSLADTNIQLKEEIAERKRAEEKIKEYSENLEDMVEQRTSELEDAQEAMLNLVEDLNKSKDELEEKALELEEMNIKIQEATEAKSRFLANMSHELRTPLNAIIGFSEILEDQTFGELNVKQTRYINNVLVSGRHLLQLINDILDLSKVEAGKLELELSRVNIKGMLENSLIMIKEKAMKHGIRLDSHISQEVMGLEILADERKLKQIMFNLLSNAAKFTPDGGEIRLSAELISDFGSQISELKGKEKQTAIEISVADTGIGIKPEDQERVFGEFEQLDSTYARQQQGTGLGLALTRRLIKLHGGRIWVESEGEGKGSTFTFVIPIKAEERKIEIPAKPEEPLPSRPDVDDSRPLVLVVEDDRQASELIRQYLSEADYAVAHAFDGKQAIQMARELKPFVITLDILLPEKDGWEVLAELKSLPETKEIPVVIVSITEKRQLGLNLGAIEYFVKPVNKVQLIEAVRKAGVVLGKEKITVLVVDDKPQTVELLTDELQAEGFNVLKAYGGQQGIDLALEKHPDVIILDLMMPEVSGFDVVQQLREHSEAMKIPILIFTAKDLTEEDRQRLKGHVKMIASKSGSGKEDLLRELERLVKRKPNR